MTGTGRSGGFRPPRVVALIAVVVAAGGSIVACADDGPRPLTDEQASALSQVLVRNYDAGGAEFVADVTYGSDSELRLDGVIDWIEHGGLGELTTTVGGDTTDVTDVAWTDTEVAVRPAGSGDDAWTFRPVDTDGVPLDRVIALVVASAGPDRDNPLLVAQSAARWLRSDTVDGADGDVDVDVIDGGGRLVFWIGADDGLLYRLEADIEGFDGETVIDYRSHGPVELDR